MSNLEARPQYLPLMTSFSLYFCYLRRTPVLRLLDQLSGNELPWKVLIGRSKIINLIKRACLAYLNELLVVSLPILYCLTQNRCCNGTLENRGVSSNLRVRSKEPRYKTVAWILHGTPFPVYVTVMFPCSI